MEVRMSNFMWVSLVIFGLCSCDSKETDPVESTPVEDAAPTIQGSIEYVSVTADGDTICDRTIRFGGAGRMATPLGDGYTGDCPQCDYSFQVEAEVTEDRGDADCEMAWSLSLIPEADYQEELFLGFASAYDDYATNVLWVGAAYYYGGYYYEGSSSASYGETYTEWTPIAWEWTEEYQEYRNEYYGEYGYYYYGGYQYGGTASLVDGALSWTATRSQYHVDYAWFLPGYGDDLCDDDDDGYGYGYGYGDSWGDDSEINPATGFVGDGALPCPQSGYSAEDEIFYEKGAGATKPLLEWGNEPPRTPTADKTMAAGASSDRPWSWSGFKEWGAALVSHVLSLVPLPDHDTGDWGDTGWGGSDYRSNELVDVWTIDLIAGDEVLVTVDTLDDESGFDPGILVTGPDSCPLMSSDDSFNCTAGETEWELCPGVKFMADTDGTYHLIVQTIGCGEADEVTYQIGVDAPSDPNLSLIEDDVGLYEIKSIEHTATGTATITVE